MSKAPNVVIGIASLQSCDINFAVSLAGMCAMNVVHRIGFSLYPIVNHTIPNAHNKMVRHAEEIGATHLMLVETDNTFPHDALKRLLERDKAIVGATYLTKSPPHTYMGREIDNTPLDVTRGVCRKVGMMPVGCMLIRMDVFAKLRKPGEPMWYTPWIPDLENFATDDYPFFERARAAGFDVYCDMELTRQVGHMSSSQVLAADHARSVNVGEDGKVIG